jgi:hypothetical protein
MKKLGMVGLLVGACLALTSAGALLAETSTRPPKNLKKVGDHWTPWDPPAAGAGAYVIQSGDTLWDLAQRWLSDPYLWPQIWDENRYILDSHWIYPGDPLVVPAQLTVVPQQGLPPVVTLAEPEASRPVNSEVEQEPEHEVAVTPTALPIADQTDLYCSGYIEADHVRSDLWIAGHEIERVALAEGDVIYLSAGRDQGLHAGDEFAIIRETRRVDHPVTGDRMGTLIRRLGKARIMLAHDKSATAVIQMSCEDLRKDDELVPWVEVEGPQRHSLPAFERYDPSFTGGYVGYIVAVQDNLGSAGSGHTIQVDIGQGGVKVGDVLTLYRENTGDLPRMKLGQAVILTVRPESATAKIIMLVREATVGDRVEVVQ